MIAVIPATDEVVAEIHELYPNVFDVPLYSGDAITHYWTGWNTVPDGFREDVVRVGGKVYETETRQEIWADLDVTRNPTSVVYASETGTKYHKVSCHYVEEDYLTMSVAEAIASNLTPCGVCKP